MKQHFLGFFCAAMAVATVAAAQPTNESAWLGVWQGELDGQPSVTLTLADDTGDLGGTVVLNIIQKENGQPHVVAMEPHVLLNPHVDGDVLSFQFRKLQGGMLDFTVKLSAAGKATIHCSNCGADAPTVDLVRAQ
jgi:hypothetical protein